MLYYDTIVLSSGGVLGIGHIGVLAFLKEKNVLDKIINFGGCSAGSLVCYYHILGFDPIDILTEIYEVKLFPDSTAELAEQAFLNISKTGSVLNNKILLDQLKKRTIEKMGQILTFKQLYEKTNKNLEIVAVNEDTKNPVYFNHLNTPNVLVYKAVAASCAIPMILNPVVINNEEYCDGVCMDPFPIKHLDHSNRRILGIWLDKPEKKVSKMDVFSRVSKYLSMMTTRFYKITTENLSENCIIKELMIDVNLENMIKIPSPSEAMKIYMIGYRLLSSPYFPRGKLEVSPQTPQTPFLTADNISTDILPTDNLPTDNLPTDNLLTDDYSTNIDFDDKPTENKEYSKIHFIPKINKNSDDWIWKQD